MNERIEENIHGCHSLVVLFAPKNQNHEKAEAF
jgi:hypothetical protein